MKERFWKNTVCAYWQSDLFHSTLIISLLGFCFGKSIFQFLIVLSRSGTQTQLAFVHDQEAFIMKTKLFGFFLLSFLLVACSSSTAYRSADNGRYGYSDAALGEDRHRVVFTQRSGDVTAAMDYALLRAAELTLLEGREWFLVHDRQTVVEKDREPSVSLGASQQRVVERRCGLLGCNTTSRPAAMAGHVSAGSGSNRNEVQAILEIELGSGQRPESGNVYSAPDTRNALRNRLGVSS